MQFIETPIFTKLVNELLHDDKYRELQLSIALRPEAGNIIPGSGGLRKIRWRLGEKGKRGGIRVIYYWEKVSERIFMLFIYKKKDKDDLTQKQTKILKNIVKEWLYE